MGFAPAPAQSTASPPAPASSAASSDQHRDAMHRIAAIPLRIPEAGLMRLHRALGIGGAGPDLEITVGGQFQRRSPALPVIFVLRLLQRGALPARAEVGGEVDLLDRQFARP